MAQNQIRGGQVRSGTIANAQIANNAEIALSKIAGGTDLSNRIADLESDAIVTREVPSGSVNGSNVTFTLANTPVAGSEQVFLNGLLQDPGAGNSYTIAGAVITFLSAPLSGDEIHVTYATGDYMVAPGGSGSGGIEIVQDAEYTWSFSGVRDIVHNKGRRPDIIKVFQKNASNNRWVEAVNLYHHSGLNPGDRGWYDQSDGVDTSTTTRIWMGAAKEHLGNPQTRIRLYWLSSQDVGTASAGAITGLGGAGAGSHQKQVLTTNGSTTEFSLTYQVSAASSILVVSDGVIQEPDVSYSLTEGGTKILFSYAPLSSERIYIVYL